jgi:hypothetical protein
MAKIHTVLRTDDEIVIVQVDDEILVCHVNCKARGNGGMGFWMMIPLTGAGLPVGWWRCAGTGCGFEMFNDGTVLNRGELKGSTEKDIAWWVAAWAGVQPADVEVSIDGR